MCVRKFTFSLRSLLIVTLGCGLLAFVITSVFKRATPVYWSVCEHQQQIELCRQSGESVLLRIEGHAGGSHQYVRAAAIIESEVVNRELQKLDARRFRVNKLTFGRDEIMAEASVPNDSIPVLVYIPQGDLKRAVWQKIYDGEDAVSKFIRHAGP
jgi:hypothetical protein